MMADQGGLLAISELSLPSSQLHSGTCWANLLLPLVAGNFNKAGGRVCGALKEPWKAKMLLFCAIRSLGTGPGYPAYSVNLQGLVWFASHRKF